LLRNRNVVIALAGALAELIGQTIGRIAWIGHVPWTHWYGSASPAQMRYICSGIHAQFGGQAGESSLCHQASAVMDLALVLNVTGFILLTVAAVRWLRKRRQYAAVAP
jgi:hypothetical protein